MLKRVDNYVKSEAAFRETKLTSGEFQRKEGTCTIRPTPPPLVEFPTAKRADLRFAGDQKKKTTMTDEKWMNVPITFPPIPACDLSEEALVMEAEIEGYIVRRIHIDEGASIEIMYEHCFNMLHPTIKSRLTETQTIVSGFSGEEVKPLGKIELKVCFGGRCLCCRAIKQFTVILDLSPYNIILGRPRLKQLRAIPSTIYGMMKFLTPWGVATLVSQAPVVFECR
ncbi:reverse transcriptase domain-containing protein [Tanacetum coccineum]